MIYLTLFFEFFKTGLFSVGGGLATVPFLQDLGARTGWFTSADLANMLAVAESTPGPIGINTATYVGYTVGLTNFGSGAAAVLGAIVATLGLVAPSVIVILIIATFLQKFRNNKYVEAVFSGLRPCSVALIAAAGIGIVVIAFFGLDDFTELLSALSEGTQAISFRWEYVCLAAALIVATRFIPKVKKWHPIVFIGISAVVGILFKFA